MTPRLPSDLLDRPAQESSRLLALSYLDQIDRAHRRLRDSDDREALHDFRVGLRRLRSCVRAYRRQLKGSMTGKMRVQLRELTRATNLNRDTEVQLAWLQQQAPRIEAEDTHGFFWFTGMLEGRKLASHDPAIAQAGRHYMKAAVRLRRRLAVLRIEIRNNLARKPPTFGQVTGELIRHQIAQVRQELTRVGGVNDIEEAHRARIAVKRLRYLLEPVARSNRRARALISRLKAVQDLLGEHHDMHVISEALASARAGLAGGETEAVTRLHRGLGTLERLASEQAVAAFERFHSLFGGESAERVLTRAEEIGSSLRLRPPERADSVPPPTPASVVNQDAAATAEGRVVHSAQPV